MAHSAQGSACHQSGTTCPGRGTGNLGHSGALGRGKLFCNLGCKRKRKKKKRTPLRTQVGVACWLWGNAVSCPTAAPLHTPQQRPCGAERVHNIWGSSGGMCPGHILGDVKCIQGWTRGCRMGPKRGVGQGCPTEPSSPVVVTVAEGTHRYGEGLPHWVKCVLHHLRLVADGEAVGTGQGQGMLCRDTCTPHPHAHVPSSLLR